MIATILTGLIFWFVGLVSCTLMYCYQDCNVWSIEEILKVLGVNALLSLIFPLVAGIVIGAYIKVYVSVRLKNE